MIETHGKGISSQKNFAKKFEDIEPRIKHGTNTDSNPYLIRVPSVAADSCG